MFFFLFFYRNFRKIKSSDLNNTRNIIHSLHTIVNTRKVGILFYITDDYFSMGTNFFTILLVSNVKLKMAMAMGTSGLLSAESARIVFVETIVSWFVYLCK